MSSAGVQVMIGARRDLAQRAAFVALVSAGDPVATAIESAVRSASTVELSEALVARTRQVYEQTGRMRVQLSDEVLFDVMVSAFQAAGFEVTT
jgi:hypothetical protein